MSYISDIFERLNIQQLGAFVLNGVAYGEVDQYFYKERIQNAQDNTTNILRMKFPDRNEYENITETVFDYASTIQNVYMEIGIQVGAQLVTQLLLNNRGEEK